MTSILKVLIFKLSMVVFRNFHHLPSLRSSSAWPRLGTSSSPRRAGRSACRTPRWRRTRLPSRRRSACPAWLPAAFSVGVLVKRLDQNWVVQQSTKHQKTRKFEIRGVLFHHQSSETPRSQKKKEHIIYIHIPRILLATFTTCS